MERKNEIQNLLRIKEKLLKKSEQEKFKENMEFDKTNPNIVYPKTFKRVLQKQEYGYAKLGLLMGILALLLIITVIVIR